METFHSLQRFSEVQIELTLCIFITTLTVTDFVNSKKFGVATFVNTPKVYETNLKAAISYKKALAKY